MRIATFSKPALLSSLFLSTLAGCVPPGGVTHNEDPALAASALGVDTAGAVAAAEPAPGSVTFTGTAYAIRSASIGSKGTKTKYYFKDSAGKTRPLALTAAQAATLKIGDGGLVKGVQLAGFIDGKTIKVTSILVNGAVIFNPHAVTGHKRFATLLCRFSELPFPASEDSLYFEKLLGNTKPGLRDYFTTASNGALDFDADPFSFVSADFPDSVTEYLDPATGLVDNVGALVQKCAEIANGAVYMPDYDGVVMLFSHNLGEGDGRASFAGNIELTNDNVIKTYHLAALTPTAFRSQKLTAQAVGDALGVLKTTDSAGELESNWDLLSGGGTCSNPDPAFGCVAPLPAMPNRAIAGWMGGAGRAFAAPAGVSETILDSADIAPASGRYSMIRVPSATAGTSYSIEFRQRNAGSYDMNVPATGVIIHRYQTNPSGVVSGIFVDHGGDGNPNNDASVFLPGQQYDNPADKVFIKVFNNASGGRMVRVTSQKVMLTVTKPTGGTIVGPGINCGMLGNDCSQAVDVGSTISLAATSGENFVFNGWTAGCSLTGYNGCTLTMVAPVTVAADFDYFNDPLPPICRTKPNLPQCTPEP
jgi:hypothetical protein